MIMQLRWLAGKLLNLCGFSSPIRECEYTASICRAQITVRQRELFTIVSINGLDVYFHRLTGHVDGVGFSPIADCKLGATAQLEHLAVRLFDGQAKARTGSQSD